MHRTYISQLERGLKSPTVRTLALIAAKLKLTPDESSYIEMKIALSQSVRARRADKRLTQMQLARLLKSSQSRVAKIEAGDKSVSIDLLVRSLVILGASRRDLAQVIAG